MSTGKITRHIVAYGILFTSTALYPDSVSIGDTVPYVTVRDLENQSVYLPELGRRVIAVWYTDPDAVRENQDLALALKKANIPSNRFLGIGVANLKDAPLLPDFLIRILMRRQAHEIQSHDRRVKHIPLYSDPDQKIKQAWNLAETDDRSIVILLDKNRKVRYINYNKLSEAEIDRFVNLVRILIK